MSSSTEKQQHPFNHALLGLKQAFGSMLPPRSSFENWPDCFLQYEEIVFQMPEKMLALDNVSKFRSWMENCVNKVLHFYHFDVIGGERFIFYQHQ